LVPKPGVSEGKKGLGKASWDDYQRGPRHGNTPI